MQQTIIVCEIPQVDYLHAPHPHPLIEFTIFRLGMSIKFQCQLPFRHYHAMYMGMTLFRGTGKMLSNSECEDYDPAVHPLFTRNAAGDLTILFTTGMEINLLADSSVIDAFSEASSISAKYHDNLRDIERAKLKSIVAEPESANKYTECINYGTSHNNNCEDKSIPDNILPTGGQNITIGEDDKTDSA